MSALCRLGLQEIAIEQLPSLETFRIKSEFGPRFFESLMAIMSDIGIFSQNSEFKSCIFDQIDQVFATD